MFKSLKAIFYEDFKGRKMTLPPTAPLSALALELHKSRMCGVVVIIS